MAGPADTSPEEALRRLAEAASAARRLGRLDEAAAHYEQAIGRRPDAPELHYNLGLVRRDQGRVDLAAGCWRRAVELRPHFVEAHNNLGSALLLLGDPAGAAAEHRKALAAFPDSVPAHLNLGNALRAAGEAGAAIESYRKAAAMAPRAASVFQNLGLAFQDLGRFAEAEDALRRAATLDPEHAEAHKSLGMLLLLLGRFAEGWEELHWRWKTPWHPRRPFAQPEWQGEDIAGRTILLHAEQGHGDTIHFARYAKPVAARGARVVLETHPALARLLATLPEPEKVVARGDPLPAFDVHCPLLNLPRLFGTRLETVPAEIPYLSADPAAAGTWRARLAARPGLKVGLVWAGNPAFVEDRHRSPGAKALAPVLAVEGAAFYALQVGPAAALDGVKRGERVTALGHELADFADTAACIAALDLVISSCTSVAHLAGAMGKPVWIALRYACDWRWLTGREDSPWYPTARLFRQNQPGDWAGVMDRVAGALGRQIAG